MVSHALCQQQRKQTDADVYYSPSLVCVQRSNPSSTRQRYIGTMRKCDYL